MARTAVRANILCHEDMTVFKLIVTNGEWTTQVPVKNTTLKTVKKTAMSVFGVKPGNILVSQIFDGHFSDHDKYTS